MRYDVGVHPPAAQAANVNPDVMASAPASGPQGVQRLKVARGRSNKPMSSARGQGCAATTLPTDLDLEMRAGKFSKTEKMRKQAIVSVEILKFSSSMHAKVTAAAERTIMRFLDETDIGDSPTSSNPASRLTYSGQGSLDDEDDDEL